MNLKETFFDDKLISKPWGSEYVIYRNKKKLSITLVKIKKNKSTSLHCHPKKKTGFIILQGKMRVQIGLYEKNSKTFFPQSRLVIRSGLFHSLKSLSNNGTIALEFETPVKKNDLLRFQDKYGRTGKPYEKNSFRKLNQNDIIFTNPKNNSQKDYYFGKMKVSLRYLRDKKDLSKFKKNSTCAILDGKIVDRNNISVLSYGEIVRIETIKKFLNFYSIQKKILVLVASKI